MEKKCENFNRSLIMYLEILEDLKQMKDIKEKKDLVDKKNEEESDRERSDYRKSVILQNYHHYLKSEEIKESEVESSPIPFNTKDEDGEDVVGFYKKENASPKVAFKLDSSDLDERKRSRLENNLKYLKNMNYLQDTPRTSCIDPPNNPSNLNNLLEKENSGNKNHVNANIKKPVARKSSIGKVQNWNSLGLILRGIKNQNNNENMNYSTNTPLNVTSNFNNNNNNDGSLIMLDNKPFFNQEAKSMDVEKMDRPISNLISSNTLNQNLTGSFLISNKDKQNSNVPKGLQLLRTSLIGQLGLSNQIEFVTELKKTKKELELYKTTVTNLSDELLYLKSHNFHIDKIISDFQDSQKKIFKCEIENFNHTLKVYKCLYDEEVKSKRKVIEELAKIVDEIHLNSICIKPEENSQHSPKSHQRPQSMTFPNVGNMFSNYMSSNSFIQSDGTTRNKPVVYDYLKYKKDKILNIELSNENQDSTSVMKIAEAMLKDGGTATKKLDYILFQIENNFDDLRIEFGSGLNGHIPSKSPLYRNLKLGLVGDTTSDVESPLATE